MPTNNAANISPSVLANAIMGKVYDILTSGDDTVPKSEDNFFAWATPSYPICAEDFNFLTQGFTGVLKKAAVDTFKAAEGNGQGDGGSALTPEQINALLAQDVGQLFQQAENFSRLVDFVPDTSRAAGSKTTTLNILNNEGTLSDAYEYILRLSQVMQSELSPETKAKIDKFRSLLSVKTKKKNLIDDSEIEVEEPSPLVKIYHEKLKAYEDAALEYNANRIEALAAENPKAVQYWAINANILRNRVKAAMDDWISSGYKNDYEAIAAFIDQVMQRDMSLLKAAYKDALDKARLTGLASGSDFYYASVIPGHWVTSSGWTNFHFASSDFQRYESSAEAKSSGGGSFFGLFGGGGEKSHEESHMQFSSDYFSLSFSITQVPIVKAWFKTQFLLSKTWRFDQENPEAKGQMVSDGRGAAKGLLIPAYPTSMICIKDLTLSFGDNSGFQDYMNDSTSGGGCVTFGPLTLGGTHSNGNSQRSVGYHFSNQGMTVDGMQIIGFKCHVVPKSPDPLKSITKWI